jgi:hypothetical protein
MLLLYLRLRNIRRKCLYSEAFCTSTFIEEFVYLRIEYVQCDRKLKLSPQTREYIEWRWPLFCVHAVMMVFRPSLMRVRCARPPPLLCLSHGLNNYKDNKP